VVDAFSAAAREGDFDALVALLDPDVVVRADRVAAPAGAPREARGARVVAGRALAYSLNARFAQPALVNGAVGVVVAPRGRLLLVLAFTFRDGKVAGLDVLADPARLRQLDLVVLDD
jgi:RNA polymerase sigma-70 factor (ECF subfamily)